MTAAQPPATRNHPWLAIVAAAALILPLGSIYAFSVFLKPLETLLGATRENWRPCSALPRFSTPRHEHRAAPVSPCAAWRPSFSAAR